MEREQEVVVEVKDDDPPGIVIRATFGPVPQPVISAFIWGRKVRPVPELPYGKQPAA
jgi:hypothetical protein